MPKAPNHSRAIPFKAIRARAEKRKGGPEALKKLLPRKPDAKALAKLSDDRILAEMTQRVFSAGFAWSVIEAKWAGFEAAFLGFEPGRLSVQPDEFWAGIAWLSRLGAAGQVGLVTAGLGFDRLLDIRADDVIRLDRGPETELPIRAGKRARFLGRPGTLGGNRAVQITGVPSSLLELLEEFN